jgi:formylmethanofuran dehydrogenase subunit E
LKRTVIPAALACLVCCAILAAGCGPKPGAATCADCGMDVAKDKATLVGGKLYCGHCAAAQAAEPAGEQHVCAACGMTMGLADMVLQDDLWYCGHCTPAPAAADSTPAAPAGP